MWGRSTKQRRAARRRLSRLRRRWEVEVKLPALLGALLREIERGADVRAVELLLRHSQAILLMAELEGWALGPVVSGLLHQVKVAAYWSARKIRG